MQTPHPSFFTTALPFSETGKPSIRESLTRWLAAPWLHAWLIFSGLVVLSTASVIWLEAVALGLMGICVFSYLFRQAMGFKEIFFYGNVRDESWFQRFRVGVILPAFVALLGALILPLSLVVFLLTVQWYALALVLGIQLAFFPIHGWLDGWFGKHLKPHSKRVVVNFLSVLSLGVITTGALIGIKWLELKFFLADSVLNTTHQMASHVIDHVEHHMIWLQHLASTMLMFELQLARAHGFAQGWVAHLILIYFLIPSTLAAFAMPVIHAGGALFLKKWENRGETVQPDHVDTQKDSPDGD